MNLRKIIQVAGVFLLSTVILLAGSMEIGEAVKAGNDIRYFMQKPEARAAALPTGTTSQQGIMYRQTMPRFTMRFTERASRCSSFMAVG